MKNVLKGSIFYVIIAIIVVLGINYIRGNLVENTGVTYSQFQKYVAQNKVSGVEVRQNSQGVTGELTVHLKDGEVYHQISRGMSGQREMLQTERWMPAIC